jgi:hypothetical protein
MLKYPFSHADERIQALTVQSEVNSALWITVTPLLNSISFKIKVLSGLNPGPSRNRKAVDTGNAI